ncbi:MAG TPA: helix-turn-helix domain-containing protein [Solirubrobacteraceae bacterium]
MSIDPFELPQADVPLERADAARNRQRILDAADRLFTRDGVACTSMDAIALEAGVGKGTLFRRFGDRPSLAHALLDSSEREFQERLIRGPAPLGPGGPAAERLIAFGPALLEHIGAHAEIVLAAETGKVPGRRLAAGPYGAYRAHLMMLIREANPELDAEYTAEALLAPLGADIVTYQLKTRGMTLERLAEGWEAIAQRLVLT